MIWEMKVDIKFEGEGRFQKMGAISKWVWLKLEWGLIVREVRRSCRGDLAMAKWDSVPTSGRVWFPRLWVRPLSWDHAVCASPWVLPFSPLFTFDPLPISLLFSSSYFSPFRFVSGIFHPLDLPTSRKPSLTSFVFHAPILPHYR